LKILSTTIIKYLHLSYSTTKVVSKVVSKVVWCDAAQNDMTIVLFHSRPKSIYFCHKRYSIMLISENIL